MSPVTTRGLVDPLAVNDAPEGETRHVAVYPVIAEPPSDAGAANSTVTWPLLGVTEPKVGAPGTVNGVTVTAADGAPVPEEFVARTTQLQVKPLVSPVTTTGLEPPVALTSAAPVVEHVTV